MSEIINSRQIDWDTDWLSVYTESLASDSKHIINNQECIAAPIDRIALRDATSLEINNSNNANILSDYNIFNETILNAFDFTIRNAKLYCGLTNNGMTPEGGYENPKMSSKESSIELTSIMDSIIFNNASDLGLSDGIMEIFENLNIEPKLRDVTHGTYRGILTARKCHACEQADSVIGAQVHVASNILAGIYKQKTTFDELWRSSYLESAMSDISNPQSVGFVDILILAVGANKKKFPALDTFFSSKIDGISYYEMVDMPEYKNDVEELDDN